MRSRSALLPAAAALVVLFAVVAAGMAGPVAGKGSKRRAKAATFASAPSAPTAPTAPAGSFSSTTATTPSVGPSVAPATVAPAAPASVAPSAQGGTPSPAPAAPSSSGTAPPARLAIGKGTRVLVFGDSMVASGFGQHLQKKVSDLGGTLVYDAWGSSSTTAWSKGARLDNLLVKHKPDVVIVALGANEVFLPTPEALAPRIRSIVEKFAPRPCLWVSPPLWKGETGIVGVEQRNSAPCAFHDTGSTGIERGTDGIHPTLRGGAAWAEKVWASAITSP